MPSWLTERRCQNPSHHWKRWIKHPGWAWAELQPRPAAATVRQTSANAGQAQPACPWRGGEREGGGVAEGMEGWCCTLWFSGKMRKDAAGNWEAMFLFTFSTAGVIRSHTSALHTQSFRNCTDLHKRIYDWVCCKITRAGILIETYSWHTKLLTVDHHWMLTKMRPIC